MYPPYWDVYILVSAIAYTGATIFLIFYGMDNAGRYGAQSLGDFWITYLDTISGDMK